MPVFTGLAVKVYKDPITMVWGNSIQQNDDYLFTASTRAWINFDGSAVGITSRVSLNIASIVDSGAGLYRINFTTGFTTSGYVMFGMAGRQGTLFDTTVNIFTITSTYTEIRIYQGGSLVDEDQICLGFIGPTL